MRVPVQVGGHGDQDDRDAPQLADDVVGVLAQVVLQALVHTHGGTGVLDCATCPAAVDGRTRTALVDAPLRRSGSRGRRGCAQRYAKLSTLPGRDASCTRVQQGPLVARVPRRPHDSTTTPPPVDPTGLRSTTSLGTDSNATLSSTCSSTKLLIVCPSCNHACHAHLLLCLFLVLVLVPGPGPWHLVRRELRSASPALRPADLLLPLGPDEGVGPGRGHAFRPRPGPTTEPEPHPRRSAGRSAGPPDIPGPASPPAPPRDPTRAPSKPPRCRRR